MDDRKPHLCRLVDGKNYELDGVMIIGRHADCGIVLDIEPSASRKHARFAVVGHDVYVADLGSLNGTFVNGNMIEKEFQLSNGDTLIFDEYEYEVFIPSRSADPVIDPDLTVMLSRKKTIEPELSQADIPVVDDLHSEVESAAAKNASAIQVAASEVAAKETQAREAEAEEVQAREAAAKEEEARETAAKAFQAREAEAKEMEAREAAARENKAGEAAAKEAAAKEAAIKDAAAAQRSSPQATPEIPVETTDPAAVRRPGSWANSSVVDNPDLTMLAGGFATTNEKAAQVDIKSITEPTIIVQTGETAGTVLQLVGDQTEWSIGSGADRDLQITQSGVSTNHAAIVREGSKWKIVDQMSVNGTFVNGSRVNIRYVNDADELRFGPVESLIVLPAGYKPVESVKTKENGKAFAVWKIVVPIAILLILGGAGFYAYTAGMF